MQFTKTDCENAKCIENLKLLYKQFPDLNANNDDDYNFFHCRHLNCHHIALGTTSSHCSKCGLWMCQDHCKSLSEFDEYEFDDCFCEQCFHQWINDKIQVLEKKMCLYESSRQKCTFKKNRTLKECNVEDCKIRNKLYKCETCKKSICVDHLIDETGRIHCFLCFKKYLHDMTNKIDTLKKALVSF